MANERCPVHDKVVRAAEPDQYSVHGHVFCSLCQKENKPEWRKMRDAFKKEAEARQQAAQANAPDGEQGEEGADGEHA